MKKPIDKKKIAKGMKKTKEGYDFSDEIKEAKDAFYKEFQKELDLQGVGLTSVDGKPAIAVRIRAEVTRHLVPEEYKGFPTDTDVVGTIRAQDVVPRRRTCGSTVEENEKRISAQGERTEKGLTHGTHGDEETNPRGISLP